MTGSRLTALIAAAGLVTACGGSDAPETEKTGGDTAGVPAIGTEMAMPVEDPFCSFAAVGGDGPQDAWVLVNQIGQNAYHGYVDLDGSVEKLTEVESSFGAGMETRRFVDDDESVELELILLDAGMTDTAAQYTGSIRVIHPAEGEAVRLTGACRLSEVRG